MKNQLWSAFQRETCLLSTNLFVPTMIVQCLMCVNAPSCWFLFVGFPAFLFPRLWLHFQSAPLWAVNVCEAAGALTVQPGNRLLGYMSWQIGSVHWKTHPTQLEVAKGYKSVSFLTFWFCILNIQTHTGWLELHVLFFLLWKTTGRRSVGGSRELLLATSIDACKSKPGLVLSHAACSFQFFYNSKGGKALRALFSHLLMTFSSHLQFFLLSLPSSSSSSWMFDSSPCTPL